MVGVDSKSLNPGFEEVDVLLGGSGSDTFTLGNFRKSSSSFPFDSFSKITNTIIENDVIPYYVGSEDLDYALLVDFETGVDKIKLAGNENDYLFQESEIYYKGQEDIDLIARVDGTGYKHTDLFFVDSFILDFPQVSPVDPTPIDLPITPINEFTVIA